MKIRNVLITSVGLLLLTAFNVPRAFGQHLVLFETFTNQAQPCPDPNRAPFDAAVASTVSSEGSKIIHLNHHMGNESDNIILPNSYSVLGSLGGVAGKSYSYYLGAVDRSSQIYSSGNTTTSNRLSYSADDWTSAIDFEAGQPTLATLSLVSAQLDTVTLNSIQNNILLTEVSVTLNQSFPNGLVIGYAILQDNAADNQCGSNSTINLNDVVRYCSILDTGTFVVPASQAGTYNVFSNQEVSGRTASLLVPWNYSNLRLVAWLEENPHGNFDIVNAATLVPSPGMNTLPLPATSLTLIDSAIDGHTFDPGGLNSFPFLATNVSSVDEYLSIDGGNTWSVIYDSAQVRTWPYGYVSPNLPNVSTTQGKIKLVAVNDPSVVYIEKGTFTINVRPTLAILQPPANALTTDTLKADSTFLIQWDVAGVSKVKLEYSYGQQYTTWNLIADNVTGTSFLWNPVPDTYYVAKIRITSDSDENLSVESDPFVIKKITVVGNGSVASTSAPGDLSITSIAPNPAENGESLIVRYSDEDAPRINLEVLDLLGHTVASQTLLSSQSGEASIPTQALSASAYIIRLNDGTNTVTKRVEIIR